MKRIDTDPGKFYTRENADRIAAEMTEAEAEDGDGWKYTAVHDPKGTGWSFINIHDEDGEFVAKL